MKALITGASSGIGKEMAIILSQKGYDLILVARRKKRLEELKKQLQTDVEIVALDISSTFNCMKLYNKVKNDDIEIVINNAGFGIFGEFTDTNLDQELDMIDTNIKAVHILTKLFLKDMKEKDRGYILNVASSAAFLPGPLMSSYYASKAYVLHLTEAIYEELRHSDSHVYVGSFCPGPVNTEFNDVAKVEFGVKAISSEEAADYAIRKMFQKKRIIVPGFFMKLNCTCNRFIPRKLLLKICYHIQKKKEVSYEK